MSLRVKRVYAKPAKADGLRILVDRLWPRGLKKEDAQLARWMKEIAPSSELRKRFAHDPDRWPDFKEHYFKELKSADGAVEELAELARKRRVTLLFAAKDEDRNNAVALKEYLEHEN